MFGKISKSHILVGFVCLCIGASISLLKKPTIETKYKENDKQTISINKDTHTEIVEVKRPDGTIEKKTTISNNDKINALKEKSISLEQSSKIINKHRIELYLTADKSLRPLTELSYTYQPNFMFIRGVINTDKDIQIHTGIKLEF